MINELEINEIYELVKNNKIGWREERIINDDKYLIFIRPDEKVNGSEVVFRKLIS